MTPEINAKIAALPESLQRYVRSWIGDPCWDLDYFPHDHAERPDRYPDVSDPEDYTDTLAELDRLITAHWNEEAERKDQETAAKLGLPVWAYREWARHNRSMEQARARAARLLQHYFRLAYGEPLSSDSLSEIEEIAGCFVDIASHSVQAALAMTAGSTERTHIVGKVFTADNIEALADAILADDDEEGDE